MLRSAIWLLLAFAGAVVLALVLRMNHGNVAILWPPYRIELSSNMALVLAIAAFFVLHVVLIALGKMLGLPGRVRQYRERRRQLRASRALQGSVIALFEGRFEKAEKLASVAAGENPASAGAAALIAARSAHRLGAPQRRDDWVEKAVRTDPGHSAALMTQAEFALEDQRPERALDAVDRMNAAGIQQLIALETSLAAYQQSGRWDRVIDTIRLLSRKGRLTDAQARPLMLDAYQKLLAPCGDNTDAIRDLWKSLRSDERRSTDLAAPTIVALARAGATEEARRIAVGVLDKEYDAATVTAYGEIEALASRTRLEQLERWRTRHGDQPKLLEMLGRLCTSERLWGKAETYLLRSLAIEDTVSARVALASLYAAIDRPRDASQQFEFGARLALGERPALPVMIGTDPPAPLPGAPPVPGPEGQAAAAPVTKTPALELKRGSGDELGYLGKD
jgi:HemY protein